MAIFSRKNGGDAATVFHYSACCLPTRRPFMLAAARSPGQAHLRLREGKQNVSSERCGAAFDGNGPAPWLLPRQQTAVAGLAAEGCRDKEIAAHLELSEGTVGSYLKIIY